jgi:pantetheine-phosphate adenylyltransferase
MNIAVFPGSFDPITKGHESVIRRAANLFDTVYVAIGINQNKSYLFTLEDRINWIKKTFEDLPCIEVKTYDYLTSKLCEQVGANYLIRGLRNTTDFNYEFSIAQINRSLKADLETVFLVTDAEYAAINSSIVRDIYIHGGDVSQFIPDAITL